MSAIKGVIFDLDGVLVSTDRLHFESWRRLASEEGLPFDEALYNAKFRGVSRRQCLQHLLAGRRGGASRTYTPEEQMALADRKNRYYRQLAQKLTPHDAVPGARDMLIELRQRGIKSAIGSSSCNARLILERLALTNCFDVVVDGTQVTHTKPHPEVFLLAARRLHLQACACLVVEDAPSGVEAARHAGMAVFGIGPAVSGEVNHGAPSLAGVTVDELLQAADLDLVAAPC